MGEPPGAPQPQQQTQRLCFPPLRAPRASARARSLAARAARPRLCRARCASSRARPLLRSLPHPRRAPRPHPPGVPMRLPPCLWRRLWARAARCRAPARPRPPSAQRRACARRAWARPLPPRGEPPHAAATPCRAPTPRRSALQRTTVQQWQRGTRRLKAVRANPPQRRLQVPRA